MDIRELTDAKGRIRMWTVQTDVVLSCIKKDGYAVVKKEYIDNKYGESSWIFKEAYSFFAKEADSMGFFSSSEEKKGDFPFWLFCDKSRLMGGPSSYLLQLSIPPERLLFFDMEKWQKVLSLSYIGKTEDEERAFSERLSDAGLSSCCEAFSTPYFPLFKSLIKKSWKNIFCIEGVEAKGLQAAVWTLKAEDIEEARPVF